MGVKVWLRWYFRRQNNRTICGSHSATDAGKSPIGLLNSRLPFRGGASSFSAVDFLRGMTDFSASKPSSNGVLFCLGCRSKFAASRFPASDFRGSRMGFPMTLDVDSDRICGVSKE